ncbi:MAG: acyltransferase family protein [Chloroflexi bacterium]|nr:acyltransferase family protein [Chloroflexota bacterium]
MKRLDQLTFTRFAMVMLVLFYHGTSGFYTGFLDFFPFSALIRSAPTAVSYLYVLSGFVMSLVYYKPGEKFDAVGYWRARFIRIYPLYIVSFALMCVYYFDSLLRIKPQKILANIFVVQAWIPAYSQSFNYASWSMTVEFFFYALFPFLMLWAYRQSTRKLIWTSIALWILSQAVHFTLWTGYYPEQKEFIVYSPIFHLNSFVMGVTGGIWYLREGRNQKAKPWVILSLLAVSFLLVAGYTVVSSDVLQVLPHDLQPMAGLLAPLMILFIVSLAIDQSRLSQALSRSVFVNLGETAYAIYILHVPVVWLYERALENSAIADPYFFLQRTFLPIMITIGLIAHFYVDIPLRRWLKGLLQRISMRVLLLDLAILTLSVFLVFRLRFGEGREYQSYREMERLIFWTAFLIRPLTAILLGAFSPTGFQKPVAHMVRTAALSVTIGSLAIAAIAYIGYFTGWFENFPRSVFIYDWLIVLTLSLLVRFGFRAFKIYKPDRNASS